MAFGSLCLPIGFGDSIISRWGVVDFAGGIVLHATAGTAALVVRWLSANGGASQFNATALGPVLTMVGACMLWVGWLGLTAGLH